VSFYVNRINFYNKKNLPKCLKDSVTRFAESVELLLCISMIPKTHIYLHFAKEQFMRESLA